jgi:integrase
MVNTDAELRSIIKKKIRGLFAITDGLYLKVTPAGKGYFIHRYSFNKKRKELSLGPYGKASGGLSLIEAKNILYDQKKLLNVQKDPAIVAKRVSLSKLTMFEEVAEDWLQQKAKKIKHPEIYDRVIKKDIFPYIGKYPLEEVSAADILIMVREINDSGRPSIANDVLLHTKNILKHAIKLGYIRTNAADSLDPTDAGGTEKSRKRKLSFDELEIVCKIFRTHIIQFTRDNYLCFALLLIFGVRKTELTQAQWASFNVQALSWNLEADKTKTNEQIKIPIIEEIVPILTELKYRGNDSQYLFPARRRSNKPHVSDDTLNSAINLPFGIDKKNKCHKLTNYFAEYGIEHFTVHDLRRTCRTLLSELKVPVEVAEKYLNHKLKGVLGIYDQYDYYDERAEAMKKLCVKILPLVNDKSTF